MTMLKYIGAVILSFCVWMLFHNESLRIKRKSKTEDAYLELIAHIKNMISAQNMPLDSVYLSFDNKELEESGFNDELKKGGIGTLKKALGKSDKKYCDKKVVLLMVDFSEKIGACRCPADCISLCDKYSTYISEAVSSFRSSDHKKAELYKKLGVVSASAVLLLCL